MNHFEKLLDYKYASLYDFARPKLPKYVIDLACKYLPGFPKHIVDLGCGTGLSAEAWVKNGCELIGVDIREDMLNEAKRKNLQRASFVLSDAADVDIEQSWADVVLCSQSFQWMDQNRLLEAVKRFLKPGGLFFVLRYYLLPIGSYLVEQCYFDFVQAVNGFVKRNNKTVQPFDRKTLKLDQEIILRTDAVRFAHSYCFIHHESFTAERFVAIALSQGKVYNALLHADRQLKADYLRFCEAAETLFHGEELKLGISYTLDIAIYE